MTQAYPLHWPEGRPRTKNTEQVQGELLRPTEKEIASLRAEVERLRKEKSRQIGLANRTRQRAIRAENELRFYADGRAWEPEFTPSGMDDAPALRDAGKRARAALAEGQEGGGG